MREIKFRAWDKENKKLVYFDLFDNDENYLLSGDDSFHVKNDTPIMQFTGLLDANGKEIYELDIVKNDNKIGIVEFNAPEFLSLEIKHHKEKAEDECSGCSNTLFLPQFCEVIGNKFETPELLDGEIRE